MSYATSLARRNTPRYDDVTPSFEAADFEFNAASASFEAQLDRYNRISTALNSVKALSAMFHEQVKTGVSEEQVRFYELSVESIFAAAGEPIPMKDLLVSFEAGISAEEYTTEAEKKTGSRLRAMIDWLVSQFVALGSSIKGMVNAFHSMVTNRRGAVAKMRDKAKASDRKESDVEKVSVKNAELLGNGGYEAVVTLHSDVKAHAMTVASALQADVRIISRHLEDLLKQTKFEETGATKELEAIFSALHATPTSNGYQKKYPLMKGLEIVLHFKKNENNIGVVTTEFVKPKSVAKDLPRLTVDQTVKAFEFSLDLIENNPLGKAMTDTSVAVADLLSKIKARRAEMVTQSVDTMSAISAPWFFRDLVALMTSMAEVVRKSARMTQEVEQAIVRYAVSSEYD